MNANSSTATGRQPATVLAALGAPALPMAALTLPLTIFLPAFYASVIGINLAVVGVVFTIVRIADLFFDPFVGGLMDRTRTRWGRFRPWLALGGPIVMAGGAMLFMAQPGVGPLYLAIALVIAYGGYSIVILSQMGLGATLTPDYRERSRVFAWWQVFNLSGLILVLVLPPALTVFMQIDQTTTVRTMGLVVLVLTPITILAALLMVPDAAHSEKRVHEHMPIGAYLSLFKLKSTRILLATVLLNGLALGIAASVFVFFFQLHKNISPEELSLMLAFFTLVSIFAAPLWALLGNAFGKHRAMTFGGLCFGAYVILTGIMPERGFVLYAVAAVIGGFASCSTEMMPRAMMADISDEDRLASGADRSGMLYALLLITHKMGQAVAIGIVFVILDLMGFDAKAARGNGPGALNGIWILEVVVPTLLYFAAGATIYFYPLTAKRHAAIRVELEARGLAIEAGAEPVELTDPGHLGASISPDRI